MNTNTLPMQSPLDYMISTNPSLRSLKTDSIHNESQISTESNISATLKQVKSPYTLQLIDPEHKEYKPALNSISSTPELKPLSKLDSNQTFDSLLDVTSPIEVPDLSLNSPLDSSPKPSLQIDTRHSFDNRSRTQNPPTSFSLTQNPDSIKLYRSMALKTKDPTVQLTYAKYLLETSSHYPPRPVRSAHSFSLLKSPRRQSLNSLDSRLSVQTTMPDTSLDHKKKKLLEDEGVRWIKRLAKARVPEAAYLLGSWYDAGLYGFTKSDSRALKLYTVAGDLPDAMFAIGRHREKQQDYLSAFQLYEKAAGLGLVQAFYRIAMINLNAEFGTRRNVPAAVQLLMKAAENTQGSCPEASYTLGLLLLNDYPGVDISSEVIQTYGGTFAATTYLENAAQMGMTLAQYRLGYLYEHGLYPIRVNLTKAVHYYEMAANLNHGYSMLALSRIYNQGLKVPPEQASQLALFESDESNWSKTHPRDEKTAFRWCHLASSQKIPDACYLLGWYYEMGIGVTKDYSMAYRYYTKAMKKGNHKEATERVQLLESLVEHQKKKPTDKKSPHSKNSKDEKCHIM